MDRPSGYYWVKFQTQRGGTPTWELCQVVDGWAYLMAMGWDAPVDPETVVEWGPKVEPPT